MVASGWLIYLKLTKSVVSVLALLPRTLEVLSPKFGWESGRPIDDFPDYFQNTNSQCYSGECDGDDNKDDDDDSYNQFKKEYKGRHVITAE